MYFQLAMRIEKGQKMPQDVFILRFDFAPKEDWIQSGEFIFGLLLLNDLFEHPQGFNQLNLVLCLSVVLLYFLEIQFRGK